MSRPKMKSPFRWALLVIPLALLVFVLLKRPPAPAPVPTTPEPSPPADLSAFRFIPDWTELDPFQNTITHDSFIEFLDTIYTKNQVWQKWVAISEDKKSVSLGPGDYTLHFSETDQRPPGSIFPWKRREDLSPSRALPLDGLKIALDPGHIGGEYALLEHREFRWGEVLIREGEMTLETAKLLAPMLEDLGASVTLVRSTLEPVTSRRPQDFADPRLFYRASEIHARAHLINTTIQPDLVICLHYNGTASPTPESEQNFHILVNGTFTHGELSNPDERFQMFQRLLSRTHEKEIPLAQEIAATFNQSIQLPAYRYPKTSTTAQNIANHPNLYARNLLANRTFQCPVIFMEPYIMNSYPFLTAFQKNPHAIYHGYARAVADGIKNYYAKQ